MYRMEVGASNEIVSSYDMDCASVADLLNVFVRGQAGHLQILFEGRMNIIILGFVVHLVLFRRISICWAV